MHHFCLWPQCYAIELISCQSRVCGWSTSMWVRHMMFDAAIEAWCSPLDRCGDTPSP